MTFKAAITSDHLKKAVSAGAKEFRVDADDLLGPARKRHLAYARFAVWAALRQRGATLMTIAEYFKRDHTSIMYGIGRAEELAQRDHDYAAALSLVAEDVRHA